LLVAFQRKKPAAIGIKAHYPGFVPPALATAIDAVPRERWVHEIKFDGYRVQVHVLNGAVKVFTRRGNDWTKRFRKIAADAWQVNAGRRSSTAKSWCRQPMAGRTFQSCKMN
jgi:bifunctional non-homologous end joining protein LigD